MAEILTKFVRSIFAFMSLLSLPVSASAGDARSDASDKHWSEVFRSYLQSVNEVDWKLSQASLPMCSTPEAGHGLILDSLPSYDRKEHEAVSKALGLDARPQVAAVASDSPASDAGLRPGDVILAVNGVSLVDVMGTEWSEMVGEQIAGLLARLPIDRKSNLTIERDDREMLIAITPVARCSAGTVLVIDTSVEAYSDRSNAAITTGLLRFLEDPSELALIAGHELAHVLLRDRHRQGRFGSKRKEDEADLLGAQLALCAGYDIREGMDFWLRYHDRRAFSWLPSLSHRSGKSRYRKLTAIADTLDCGQLGSVLADAP